MFRALIVLAIGIAIGYGYGWRDAQRYMQPAPERLLQYITHGIRRQTDSTVQDRDSALISP